MDSEQINFSDLKELPKQVLKLLKLIEKENKETVELVKSPREIKLGSLITFVYDPKHKQTLPFFDILPLAIPLARYGDRLLALNCHYLPYTFRISLVTELMKRISWKKRLQYRDIKAAIQSSKMPHAMLYYCIRSYLYNHIRSEVKAFHTQNFQKAVREIMPRFKKETEENIYRIIMSKTYKRVGGVNPKK